MSIGTVWLPGTWENDTWETGSWADVGSPVAPGITPPSPTVLLFADVTTSLEFYANDGSLMSIPVMFTAGSTGPITVKCVGADGTVEDLSTAFAVTLRVVNVNGTVAVNSVTLSNLSSNGTAVWTRTGPQVGAAGDYRAQISVFRSNGTTAYYPTAQTGAPLTILPAV